MPDSTPQPPPVESPAADPGGTHAESAPAPVARPEPATDTHTRHRALSAESWAEQGIQLCRKARWKDAIDPLRRAIEFSPDHPVAHFYLGEAYNHTDDLPAALAAFEAAVRANPTYWRAFKGIGIVLDRMRRPAEAAAAYQRARELQRETATPPRPDT